MWIPEERISEEQFPFVEMAFDSGTAYPESDADDEYERSVHDASPVLPTDDEEDLSGSEGTRGQTSNEHTPTTYGRMADERQGALEISKEPITEWDAEDCADFISSLGVDLAKYAQDFVEHNVDGVALIAFTHAELTEMGIKSVGHRLTILKAVYDVKIKQDIPIEKDDYIPASKCLLLCFETEFRANQFCSGAEGDVQLGYVSQDDLRRALEEHDRRSIARSDWLESELRRLQNENRRLREELLPVFKMIKEDHPLPSHPSSSQQQPAGQGYTQQYANAYGDSGQTASAAPTPALSGGGLQRKFSTKQFFLNSTPKNVSPTHLQSQERGMMEASLDPSSAAERAVLSSSHLSAINGAQQSPGLSPHQAIPSPTSPPHQLKTLSGSTLATRSYGPGASTRTTYADENSTYQPSTYGRESIVKPPPSSRRAPTPNPSSGGNSASSVEIFKSFKVGMEDPCWMVLPAALKKYNISAPPEQYALYIVYGDQERCLERDEKPLILFKELDKGGKKPMFMLRKTNMHPDSQQAAGSGTLPLRRGNYDPPGGII